MNEISNKAIVIAVSLLVTIAITSSILLIFSQIKEVYSAVQNTDTSIRRNFQEFDAYDNTEKTGMDLLNVSKKYVGDSQVKVMLGSVQYNINQSKVEAYIDGLNDKYF